MTMNYPPPFKAVDSVYNVPVPVMVAGQTFLVREIGHVQFVSHALLIHSLLIEVEKQHPDVAGWSKIKLDDLISTSLPTLLISGHAALVAFVADVCDVTKDDSRLGELPLSAFLDLTMSCIEAQRPAIVGFSGAGGRMQRLLKELQPPAAMVVPDGNHQEEAVATTP